jgi:hypothetical protein
MISSGIESDIGVVILFYKSVRFACKRHVMRSTKPKIEVHLTEDVKRKVRELCESKGISFADGMRRAIELWIKHESSPHR